MNNDFLKGRLICTKSCKMLKIFFLHIFYSVSFLLWGIMAMDLSHLSVALENVKKRESYYAGNMKRNSKIKALSQHHFVITNHFWSDHDKIWRILQSYNHIWCQLQDKRIWTQQGAGKVHKIKIFYRSPTHRKSL